MALVPILMVATNVLAMLVTLATVLPVPISTNVMIIHVMSMDHATPNQILYLLVGA